MSKEKKYRFYYSRKQNAVDEDMWGFTPRYTFVKTPDGYKQYSELCSIKGTSCNWEDAELVYETDEMPEIVVHEAIPELIAELEHRLANCIESKEDYYVIVSNGWKNKKYGIARVKQVVENHYIQETDEYLGSYSADREYGEFATLEEAKAKLEELNNG